MQAVAPIEPKKGIIIESWNPDEKLEPKIQLLPFKIEYDGPANIDTFFIPEKTSFLLDGESTYKCSFRGRRLMGSEIHLPSDYKGIIFRENLDSKAKTSFAFDEKNDNDDNLRIWRANRSFTSFIYWTKKPEPSYQDMPRRWIQWMEMAKSIHKPVTQEDLSKPLKFILKQDTNNCQTDESEEHINIKKRTREDQENESEAKRKC